MAVSFLISIIQSPLLYSLPACVLKFKPILSYLAIAPTQIRTFQKYQLAKFALIMLILLPCERRSICELSKSIFQCDIVNPQKFVSRSSPGMHDNQSSGIDNQRKIACLIIFCLLN